jgi:hypothetical protein
VFDRVGVLRFKVDIHHRNLDVALDGLLHHQMETL